MQTSPLPEGDKLQMQVTLPQMQFTDDGIASAKNGVLWLTHQPSLRLSPLIQEPEE